MAVTVGELFAGIGGFSLAFHAAGAQTAWFVEKEPFCQMVLAKNFPGVPVHGDIYECHDLPYVDVLTAGFPCQPFSVAGKRAGVNDERYLVPEMFRVIQEVQPRVAIFENVPGFASIAAGDTLKQFFRALAEMGYLFEWGHLAASDVGAPHRRTRWFCVAYHDSEYRGTPRTDKTQARPATETVPSSSQHTLGYAKQLRTAVSAPCRTGAAHPHQKRNSAPPQPRRHTKQPGPQRTSQLGHPNKTGWRKQRRPVPVFAQLAAAKRPGGRQSRGKTQPGLGGIINGVPHRLDEHCWPARPGQSQYTWEPPRIVEGPQEYRTARLKALGNAVVPQVVYPVACEIVAWLQAQEGAAE